MPTPEPDSDLGGKVDNLAESVEGLREDQRENKRAQEENTAAQQEATRALLEKQSKAEEALAATQRQGRKTRRQTRALVVLAAIQLVIIGWLYRDARQREAENVDRLVAACQSSNGAREQSQARIEDAGSTLTDSFARVIAGSNTTMTPEAEAQFYGLFGQVKADYVQHMRDNWPVELRPRGCSEDAVTAATVVGTTKAG